MKTICRTIAAMMTICVFSAESWATITYRSPHRYNFRSGAGTHEETVRFANGEYVILSYQNGVRVGARWFDSRGNALTDAGSVHFAEQRHPEYVNHVPESISVDRQGPVINNSAVAIAGGEGRSGVVSAELAQQQAMLEARERAARAEYERKRPSEVWVTSYDFQDSDLVVMPPERIWTDHKGGKIKARWECMTEDGNKLVLVTNSGRRINAVFSKFSVEDQEFVQGVLSDYRKKGYVLYKGKWYVNNGVSSHVIRNGGFNSDVKKEVKDN